MKDSMLMLVRYHPLTFLSEASCSPRLSHLFDGPNPCVQIDRFPLVRKNRDSSIDLNRSRVFEIDGVQVHGWWHFLWCQDGERLSRANLPAVEDGPLRSPWSPSGPPARNRRRVFHLCHFG